jgi:hypothetical protein
MLTMGMYPNLPENISLPAHLLWLIREGRVYDTKSLLDEAGINGMGTPYYSLNMILSDLARAQLIVQSHDAGIDRYAVSPNWEAIQMALRLSLRELATLGPSSMVVTPHFGQPDSDRPGADIFVAMPFDRAYDHVYNTHISRCGKSLGLTIARGDNIVGSEAIMKDIWNAIARSCVVVADCSGLNPNVFYEVGIAHAIGRPVILVAHHGTVLPFDTGHLRHIFYEDTSEGMAVFETQLTDAIAAQIPGRHTHPVEVLVMPAGASATTLERLRSKEKGITEALQSMGNEVASIRSMWNRPDIAGALNHRYSGPTPTFWHLVGSSQDPSIKSQIDDELSPWPAADLAKVMAPAGLDCVILDGCFDRDQADAMLGGAQYVIGLPGQHSSPFTDEFYRGLAAGRDVPTAFVAGRHRQYMESDENADLPVLLARD